MTDSTSTTPVSAPKPGSITLARHGEPALSRKIRLNAAEYREWWGRYELGGILPEQAAPHGLLEIARGADVIFASERRRAIESATLVVGDKTFVRDPVFIEAPLPPPPFPAFVRFNPKIWGFVSRFCWWYFGYSDGEESRKEAEARAARAADLLTAPAEAGQEVLVLAHGFFNTMIGIELKRRGWRRVDGRGWRYWNTRRFAKG
jgi:broad specificity phosphatase PhoE